MHDKFLDQFVMGQSRGPILGEYEDVIDDARAIDLSMEVIEFCKAVDESLIEIQKSTSEEKQFELESLVSLCKEKLSELRKDPEASYIDVSKVLMCLANVHYNQSKSSHAIAILDEVSRILKKLSSDRNLLIAELLLDLALLYYKGGIDMLEPLFNHSLEIKKSVLGENHPSVRILSNIKKMLLNKIGFKDHHKQAELYAQKLETLRALFKSKL